MSKDSIFQVSFCDLLDITNLDFLLFLQFGPLIQKFSYQRVNYIFISADSGSKRPRLEQIPAANLDADDPLDDDVSNLSCSNLWNDIQYSSNKSSSKKSSKKSNTCSNHSVMLRLM